MNETSSTKSSDATIGILGISNPYVWNVIDLAKRLKLETVLVANQKVSDEVGLSKWHTIDNLNPQQWALPFVTGVVKPSSKEALVDLGSGLGIVRWASLVSPDTAISGQTSTGIGVILRQFSVIDSWVKLGNHVTVSPGVTIGHHSVVGDFCHVANGATICGSAVIGSRVYVGAGSTIRDGISIGDHATIGMGAVVVDDVEPGTVMTGNPARPR